MKICAGSVVPPQHSHSQRVMRLANRILDANKDLPEIRAIKNWTFTVLNDSSRAAFSLPV